MFGYEREMSIEGRRECAQKNPYISIKYSSDLCAFCALRTHHNRNAHIRDSPEREKEENFTQEHQ